MTRVLVTGASGFVGSAICEALASRGVDIVAMDFAPSPFAAPGSNGQFTFVAGDVCDLDRLRSVFGQHEITHVVHAAALTPDREQEATQPDRIAQVNLTGACRLMMAAAEVTPARVLYLSSVSVYGDAALAANGRFDEVQSVPQPDTLYGTTKLAAETALRRLADLHAMDLRVVRLGPLFGPFEHASGARAILSPHHQITQAARAGHACVLPRAVPADWLYARDAARRIVDLLLAPELPGDVFNLGGGTVTTLIDWCAALKRLMPGFQWQIDPTRPTVRYGYPKDRPALDNRRVDEASPSGAITLDDAAADYLIWLDTVAPRLPKPEF